MTKLVTVAITDGVADVRLNRPDKYNAISPEMFDAIAATGESLAQNRSVRAVVLSGNGPGFCAGLDVSSFQQMGSSRDDPSVVTGIDAGDPSAPDGPANRFQRPAWVWKRLPVPVIAAIHGVAYGGGLQVALGADMRYAARDARLSVMEIKWGLIPDMSLTQTVRDVIRLDVLKELTFTGRVVNGEEAMALGLVTRVCEDPLVAALETAHEIALKSPDAIRAGKHLLEESWHADAALGLKLEASLQTQLIGSPNQLEAIKANFDKRTPSFVNPEV